ncbi:MAG: nascent polypeptide-associated complex protein [Candidatus Micrarchaeota archaeon]|nr:nascent polypeptide-associated complex protein [Candidatus Micrarchaeota archaeon]
MFDPRQMEQLMKRMGIKTITHKIKKVIFVKEDDQKLEINNPEVIEVLMQGQSYFQVSGKPQMVQSDTDNKDTKSSEFQEEDIKLVMDSVNVNRETAIKALKEAKGDISLAILELQKKA